MFRFDLELPTLRIGWVRAANVQVAPSDPELLAAMTATEQTLRATPELFPESTRAAVRNLLRTADYKPTGRGKPASEFLFGAATGDSGMPRVNNLVDINNLASLRSAHPISIFDVDLAGDELSVRHGREGESYVFNASGQSMDLKGLLVVCRGPAGEPIGNAVKDSMLCKVHPDTRNVLAVVYGSRVVPEAALRAVCDDLANLLRTHAGTDEVKTGLSPAV